MVAAINEFDKVMVLVPPKHYEYSNLEKARQCLGCQLDIKEDESLIINLSGKIACNSRDLGAITSNNIVSILDKLEEKLGLSLDRDYFINNATVCRLDVKRDIVLDGNPSDYISTMREVFNHNSEKYNITQYTKGSYTQGFELRPLTRSSNHKFMMYAKYPEIRNYRRKNNGYYEQFDSEFMENSIKNTVRTELQMYRFNAMRKEFGINHEEKITLAKAFDYDKNIINNKINELLPAF